MPRHGGQRVRISAFDEVQVRMAQAASRSADQHLVRTGLADDQLLDFERLVRGEQRASDEVADELGLAPHDVGHDVVAERQREREDRTRRDRRDDHRADDRAERAHRPTAEIGRRVEQ